MPTDPDELTVDWGVNNWVAVRSRDVSHQDQVTSPAELAVLFRRFGVSEDDARQKAAESWRGRPRDASAVLARPRQSMFAATGLSARAALLVLAVVVALYVFFVVYR